MSSGHCDGSTPMGTSLNDPSGAMIGFVLTKSRLNVCSTDGLRQERRHLTTHIALKRCFTSPMIVLPFAAPCPARTMSKYPPISVLASDCMNCASLLRNRLFVMPLADGNQIEITGSGVFGSDVLSAGKRP